MVTSTVMTVMTLSPFLFWRLLAPFGAFLAPIGAKRRQRAPKKKRAIFGSADFRWSGFLAVMIILIGKSIVPNQDQLLALLSG